MAHPGQQSTVINSATQLSLQYSTSMNMNFANRIKAATRLRPTSGGWIPPTETGHSLAVQSGFTLVKAATALLMMLIRGAGFLEFVFGSACVRCRREIAGENGCYQCQE
jgi:hypothetical protein